MSTRRHMNSGFSVQSFLSLGWAGCDHGHQVALEVHALAGAVVPDRPVSN